MSSMFFTLPSPATAALVGGSIAFFVNSNPADFHPTLNWPLA
jgi:hypothetical protein